MHRFTITLADDIYDLLSADAKRNCRTLSEEITYMLRTHKGSNSADVYHKSEETTSTSTECNSHGHRSVIG